MRGRTLALSGVGALLLGVTALCGLTAYSSYHWLIDQDLQWQILEIATTSAEVKEIRRFPLQTPLSLEVETDDGDISVIAADVDEIEVEIVKKAWGRSEAEAAAIAAAKDIEIQQEGGSLRLVYRHQERFNLFSNRRGSDRVSFAIRVPAETALKLSTRHGDLQATGTRGAAELNGQFGEVSIEDLKGSLQLTSFNGELSIRGLDAGEGEIRLLHNFGDCNLESLTGGDFRLQSTNSAVSIRDLASSGEVSIANQFGEIEVSGLQANSLEIEGQSGAISIEEIQVSADLEVTNYFGQIKIFQAEASLIRVSSNDGTLTLQGVGGALELENQFGDIFINDARQASLKIKSNNGKVNFSGSLDPAARHEIESVYGDIRLIIPAESALTLDLKTESGRIRSQLPLVVSGEIDETSWQAILNGGGAELSAHTTNGDIFLFPLAEAPRP